MDEGLNERLEVAIKAAKEAGLMVMDADKNSKKDFKEKNKNDFVTNFDFKSERLIIDKIKESFPEDGIFGEEGGNQKGKNGRWIIDPIDGTVNFLRGIPNYTISIAFEREKFKPLIGVVYNPRQDELFYAVKDLGSFCNGEKISVSNISNPNKAIVVVVPPHRRKEKADLYFRKMREIFDQVSDLRSFGSAALECCYIAAGRLDCYYELALGYYDFAAGMVILQESGGELRSIGGDFTDSYCDVVATNTQLTNWLLPLVGE